MSKYNEITLGEGANSYSISSSYLITKSGRVLERSHDPNGGVKMSEFLYCRSSKNVLSRRTDMCSDMKLGNFEVILGGEKAAISIIKKNLKGLDLKLR